MKQFIGLLLLTCSWGANAQSLNNILTAGIENSERFTDAYTAPVTESAIYGISNGWYNSADAKPLGGFEISVVGNITGFRNKDDKKSFELDIDDYENLSFTDGSQSKQVATGLGDITGVEVIISDDNGLFSERFELPSGLSSEDFNFIPSGYLQGSVGLIKGLEVKARFLPKIDFEDSAEISLFGAGLQYDFTKLLPADKLLPVAISAVIGYTNLDGTYDFTDSNLVDGENQRIDASFNTWNFSAVVSTRKIPVINFYGGLGYITGKSDIDVLGEYVVRSGPFQATYTDPFSVSNNVSGVTANIGTKLKLGFFRLNVEYNIAQFNTLTAGINFGFR